jgi:hypothetical protein
VSRQRLTRLSPREHFVATTKAMATKASREKMIKEDGGYKKPSRSVD